MLRAIAEVRGPNVVKVNENARRHFSYERIKEAVRNYFVPRPTLPYIHVCQIGDPVLRVEAHPVEPEKIQTLEFRRMIQHMISVMRTYKAMGLAAPQIGLPQQIFALEVTKEHLDGFSEDYRQTRGMELAPVKIFINPKMKVIDYGPVRDEEECLSILGYTATVPRAKSVRIEALDTSGKPFVWKTYGWTARIAQHEMDHLQGKLYIDRMERSTFSCVHWMAVNNRNGNMGLQYYPRHWLRRFMQL